MLRQAWETWDERVAVGLLFGVGMSPEGAGASYTTAHSVCQGLLGLWDGR